MDTDKSRKTGREFREFREPTSALRVNSRNSRQSFFHIRVYPCSSVVNSFSSESFRLGSNTDRARPWMLKFGASLDVGAWNLVLLLTAPAPPLPLLCPGALVPTLHSLRTTAWFRSSFSRERAGPARKILRHRVESDWPRNKCCVLPTAIDTETTGYRSCECRRTRSFRLCQCL